MQIGPTFWLWVLLCAALAIFTWCSFYITRLATRIRRTLEQRCPDILARIAPTSASSPHEHWLWQSDFNVVRRALADNPNTDDPDIARDAARMNWAFALSIPVLIAIVVAVTLLTSSPAVTANPPS